MLDQPSSSETLAPFDALRVSRRPALRDWKDGELRPIGRVQLLDFQHLAQLPTTDE